MARARGANAVMAGVFETTYGTVPSSGFKRLPFVSANLGEEQALIESNLLGYGRNPQDPTPDVSNNEGDVVVPVDVRAFGNWLKLFFGAPTTTEDTGVYTHVFTAGATTLPSMSIEIGFPEVPSFGRNFGVKGDRMRVALTRSGLLNATLSLVAQGETLATETVDGTLDAIEVVRFAQGIGEVSRDGTALGSVVAADFTFSNGLDKVETIRGDGRIEDADAGMVGFVGNITTRFANTTLLDQATGETPCAISFGWSRSASESLLVEAHRVFLPRPKRPVEGPGGIQTSFAYQAAYDADEETTVTITLVNDVASY